MFVEPFQSNCKCSLPNCISACCEAIEGTLPGERTQYANMSPAPAAPFPLHLALSSRSIKEKMLFAFSRARKHCCAARVPLAPQQRYSACIIARNAPRTIIADGSNACVECRDIKKRMALMRGSASDYRSWRSLKEPPTPHDRSPNADKVVQSSHS